MKFHKYQLLLGMPSQLIVGDRGQDGQILSTKLRKENLDFFCLNRLGLYSDNKLIYDYNKLSVSTIVSFFQRAQIEKIYFFASHSLPSAERSIEKKDPQDPHFEIETLLVKILDAISCITHSIKFIFANSSLRYGELNGEINEGTIPQPNTLYGLHKIKCETLISDFSKSYGNFSFLNAILFNHTSVFQDQAFLFPKIILAIKRNNLDWIIKENENEEKMSNFIDLGYAPHFIEYLAKLSKINYSENCIISTGMTYPVAYFLELAKCILEKATFENRFEPNQLKFHANNDLLIRLIRKEVNILSGKELFEKICADNSLRGSYDKA